ncbi:hypothetical protein OA57_11040 [Chelonobacter oris]|uniref:Autotransporter domain-containing protein n=1 Tax=Chelonobacter oris TaxID=505317 RepID=A0A0A3AJP0_9PAST|nr:S8 family serine peptidase [Chelonobacter oris]KGQ69541.1 hypothetical protein OA57_11040 [Chelonobacter oris]
MFQFKKPYLGLMVSAVILTANAQAAEMTDTQKVLFEYLKQPKEAIGLSDALTAQYGGKNVTVGVVDSGFFNGHDLLKNKRNLVALPFEMTLQGKNYYFDPNRLAIEMDPKSGKLIYGSHGGQVSGIIAAAANPSATDPRLNYFGGVAKESRLYQVSYEPTNGSLPSSGDENEDKKLLLGKDPTTRIAFAAAIDTLLNNATELNIMNHSWNEDPVSERQADMDREYKGRLDLSNPLVKSLHTATDKGILQVFAAGNESKRQPGVLAALPRYFPDMEKYYLSVIAVDPNHRLESYSNHCGVSRNWCIAAPGTMVLLAVQGDPAIDKVDYTFAVEQGTSYAAPTISGAAALLKQRFEYMNMAQVRDVLLTTATDLGAKGVDDTFGWGMVNVAKAVNGPAQLLGDESYTLNRDDRWANGLSAGGRLTKRGSGTLTLSGAGNRLKGVTVAGGGLHLQGDTRLSESAVVEQGELRLDNKLHADSLRVDTQGRLSGHGVVNADATVGGTLQAEGMTFLKKLTLEESAIFNLAAAHGISAEGEAAQVRLGGRVAADVSDFSQAEAGQTGVLLQLKNGADYTGAFSALLQPQALLAKGLRYDVRFNPNSVLLAINPQTLHVTTANRNERHAADALNRLRDSRLALSRNSYSRWLSHTLQSGDWQGLHRNLGNGIYANSVHYLLEQASLNRTLLHKQLSAAKSLNSGEWQVWSETGRDHSQYRANAVGKQVEYHAKQLTLGVTKAFSAQTAMTATLAKNHIDVTQPNAAAKNDETRISLAGRHYPASTAQGWFVEGDLSLAKIRHKQQRHFNGVAASSSGKTNGWNQNAGLTVGYLWQQNDWSFEPSVGLQVNRLWLKGFREQGSDLALTSPKIRKTETDLLLDLKLDRTFRLADWQLMPSLAIGYVQHLASRPVNIRSRLAAVDIEQAATAEQQAHLRTDLALTAKYHAWQATLGWQYHGYRQQKGNQAYFNVGYRF